MYRSKREYRLCTQYRDHDYAFYRIDEGRTFRNIDRRYRCLAGCQAADHQGRKKYEKVFSPISKEAKLGAINGVIIGVVTAHIAWIWYGNPYLGVVIGLGMLLNLVFAGLSGSSIPLVMKRFGLDPAQSSNIILTTVTDVLGFMAFLGFAVLFQNYLI